MGKINYISNVAVIDDRREKYKQLRRICKGMFPDAKWQQIRDSNSARRVFRSSIFELTFLDMAFDMHDHQTIDSGFEGLEGLRVLQSLHRMRAPTKVIVFTAHKGNYDDAKHSEIGTIEDLRIYVKQHFPTLCLGCVYSKENDKTIKAEIENLLR